MEKKYTPEERKKIYNKAAELIGSGKGETGLIISFCCTALKYATDKEADDRGLYPIMFPEFFLFEPEKHGFVWWDDSDYQPRVFALLLCAEMTKGATE